MQGKWYENQEHPIVKLLRDNYPNVRDDEPIRILSSRIWIDIYNRMYVVYEYCQKWDANHKYNNQLALAIYKGGYHISKRIPGMDWCNELYSPDRVMNGTVIETPQKILSDNHRKYMTPGINICANKQYYNTVADFNVVPLGIASKIRKEYIPNDIDVDIPVRIGLVKRHSEVRYFISKAYLYVDSDINFWDGFGSDDRIWKLNNKDNILTPDDNRIMCRCRLFKIKHIGE